MDKPIYLYVTPFFPSPSSWRGAFCYDAVKALINNGKYEIHVFTGGKGEDYIYQGIKVHVFKIWQIPSAVFPFLFSFWNRRSFIASVKRAGIDIDRVAVCHGHTAFYGIYPLAIKHLNPGCLTLLHHHDLESFGLNLGILRHCWLYNMIQFPILRRMHEKIDCHVFISEASRNSFLAAPDTSWTIYSGYRKQMRGLPYRSVRIKKSIILHNGVDTSIFKNETSKDNAKSNNSVTVGCVSNFSDIKSQLILLKACSIIREGWRVGCVANFSDWKNQILLLSAILICNNRGMDIKVLFVGSGPEESRCRQFVEENGMQNDVVFLREVNHEMLPDFYHSIDLFVLPSYFEGFGCVFTEAWACGVPFITCKGQGMDDLIPATDREKWLIEPGDAEGLAKLIENYFRYRPKQVLSDEIAIQPLMNKFVDEIERIISDME